MAKIREIEIFATKFIGSWRSAKFWKNIVQSLFSFLIFWVFFQQMDQVFSWFWENDSNNDFADRCGFSEILSGIRKSFGESVRERSFGKIRIAHEEIVGIFRFGEAWGAFYFPPRTRTIGVRFHAGIWFGFLDARDDQESQPSWAAQDVRRS
jgi:hypothetical protein